MKPDWTFEHSVIVHASREAAWKFWSNVANWAVVDPAVEWVRLDGPFEAGARGETKPVGSPPTAWSLAEVDPYRHARIEIEAPGATAVFVWMLADNADGATILTQRATLVGPCAGDYTEMLRGLEEGIPAGMEKLAAAIESAAPGPPS